MLPMYVPPPPIVAGPAFTRSAVSASAVLSRRHHHSGGSRIDHTPTRKVITVSLQHAVQLHTAENAWKPATIKPIADSTDPDQLSTQVCHAATLLSSFSIFMVELTTYEL